MSYPIKSKSIENRFRLITGGIDIGLDGFIDVSDNFIGIFVAHLIMGKKVRNMFTE